MIRYILFIGLFFFFSLSGIRAQIPLVRFDSVAVSRDGISLSNPWAGGLNCPQFSSIDLDGDGLRDLVAFERNFYGSVKTFLNMGEPGETVYRHAPEYQAHFPQMRNWMLLRDYNCDGKEDIFTSVPAGIAIYRNDSGPGPGLKFTLVAPLLMTFGLDGVAPLYVSPPDIPSIDDIDGDGDLDILTFNIIGSTIEYHKNLSMENTGGCGELDFELRNACWGYFSEDGNNNTVNLFDTCEVNVGDPEKSGRHAGSTILSVDLDGNGTKDLLLGDITYSNLVMLLNGGTPSASIMVEQQTDFPPGPVPVDITVFPAAYHLDVNNDGLKDLLVAPNNPNTSENYRNIWFYEGTLSSGRGLHPSSRDSIPPAGTSSLTQFVFRQDDFLQGGMIDLGERSVAAFLDEDNDGLTDIIAGSYGYFVSSGIYTSKLLLLRNTGTPSLPAFEVADEDYAGLAQYDFDGIYPAFGDLDGDGDMDMVTGDEEGHLHYFENTASAGEPAAFELTGPNYQGIDAGISAKPHVVDVNRDGLPDLLVGERSGTVKYFRNRGSQEEAAFDAFPTAEEFGGIDVMPECCTGYSAPFMVEDSLGNYVLYVGSEQGWIYLFDNIDNNLEGEFNLVDSLYLNGVNVNVNGADINNDGRLEFVYGEFAGGIGLLKYGKPQNLGAQESFKEKESLRITPNPVRNVLTVEVPYISGDRRVEVSIVDLMGREIYHSFELAREKHSIDVSGLPQGFYILVLMNGENRFSGKFIKL